VRAFGWWYELRHVNSLTPYPYISFPFFRTAPFGVCFVNGVEMSHSSFTTPLCFSIEKNCTNVVLCKFIYIFWTKSAMLLLLLITTIFNRRQSSSFFPQLFLLQIRVSRHYKVSPMYVYYCKLCMDYPGEENSCCWCVLQLHYWVCIVHVTARDSR